MERPRWSNQVKLVVSLLLLALLIYLLRRFSLAIPPLIIAAVLAYILTPLVAFLQRKLHLPRPLAILLSFLFALVLLAAFIAGFVPLLGTQFANLNLDIQRLIQNFCARSWGSNITSPDQRSTWMRFLRKYPTACKLSSSRSSAKLSRWSWTGHLAGADHSYLGRDFLPDC